MSIDDPKYIQELDSENMYKEILSIPDQLGNAWNNGKLVSLPGWTGIEQILIAGMGGSAIGGDLIAEYVKDHCPVPVILHRDYGLPAWALGKSTLVIACSHSGNTEETLSAFDAAVNSGCRVVAITTGGKLLSRAEERGIPALSFEHSGQPRAAVGYSFGLLLAILFNFGLISNQSAEVIHAADIMRKAMAEYLIEVPAVNNPAKRLAGQLVDRNVTVFGSDILSVVARRLKGQINENAKSWAAFESLPEANHNTQAGLSHPEHILNKSAVLFFLSSLSNPRNQQRIRLTQQSFMIEGISTDIIEARGNSKLAHLWSSLQFGDFVSFYLAVYYGVDPTPIAHISEFKQALGT